MRIETKKGLASLEWGSCEIIWGLVHHVYCFPERFVNKYARMGGNLFLNEIISTFNMFNEFSKFLLRNFPAEGTGKIRQENCDFLTTRAFYLDRKIHYPYTLKNEREKLKTNIKISLLKTYNLNKLVTWFLSLFMGH